MIRIVYLLVRPESMTPSEFAEECRVHYDMSRKVPALYKYEVRLVDQEPSDTHVPYLNIGPFDAVAECWFENREKYDEYLASDIRKEWFEHGKTFIGQLKPIYTREIH